ncbi:uncharacterized protein LOC124160293 isoform X3 [Ischnura elegans]|uniref:uncharacterized protein LOC124160293 isoform X3 n=1 Tax=Ischnura elegans TaxID=197161 RepID=UPI001ED892F8|nr:uncharacterized protein LOC124160293 isoform X3 [Ischnura elegans]
MRTTGSYNTSVEHTLVAVQHPSAFLWYFVLPRFLPSLRFLPLKPPPPPPSGSRDIYVHKYGPDQIEFGHVCENPQEWEQRFERKDGHRRLGKVRWGDKHGGYGEHYYDYNHGGHEGADDESDGHHSEPVPAYNSGPSYNTAAKPSEQVSVYKKAPAVQSAIRPSEPLAYYPQAPTFKVTAKRHLEPETTEYSDEAEAIAAESARVFSQDVARLVKRHPTGAAVAEPEVQASSPKLMFDLATGRVIDEVTGKTYVLQPVN